MVKITEARYRELLEIELTYNALKRAGVDNWEGYDSIFEMDPLLNDEETLEIYLNEECDLAKLK